MVLIRAIFKNYVETVCMWTSNEQQHIIVAFILSAWLGGGGRGQKPCGSKVTTERTKGYPQWSYCEFVFVCVCVCARVIRCVTFLFLFSSFSSNFINFCCPALRLLLFLLSFLLIKPTSPHIPSPPCLNHFPFLPLHASPSERRNRHKRAFSSPLFRKNDSTCSFFFPRARSACGVSLSNRPWTGRLTFACKDSIKLRYSTPKRFLHSAVTHPI